MAVEKVNNALVKEILTSTLHGKKVYLLGTAEFGPTNTPTLVRNKGALCNIYGKLGSLIEAYDQVKTGSDCEIYACKVTGTHSIAHLNVNILNGGIIEDGLIIKAKEANEIYNNIKINIYQNTIVFTFPKELGGGVRKYDFDEFSILGLLIRKINEDTDNGLNFVYAQLLSEAFIPSQGSLSCCNPNEIYMYGGNSGLNYCKNQYFYALQYTYDLLESEDIDIIVPIDAYMDDMHPKYVYYGKTEYGGLYYQEDRDYLTIKINDKPASFYSQLLLFCVKQLQFGMVTNGVMGFNKIHDKYLYEDEDNYISNVIKPSLDCNFSIADLKDYQFLISIVAGDLTFNYGLSSNNGYLLYTGLISGLSVISNSTNIPIHESVSLFNEFSESSMKSICDLGVVSFRVSPLYDKVVVYSGVTPVDKEKTDLYLYCNVRMIQLTISYIRKLFDTYIGEEIDALISSDKVKTEIELILDALIDKEVIQSYDASIEVNNDKGEFIFNLILKTVYMLEGIEVSGGFLFETSQGG